MEARKTVYTDVVNGYYDGGSSSCYRECRPRSSAILARSYYIFEHDG